MSEYDNNLTGVLFMNKERRPDKQDPAMRGSAEVDGVPYWLDAWLNVSKDGDKYFKIKFKRKEQPAKAPISTQIDDLDDALPF